MTFIQQLLNLRVLIGKHPSKSLSAQIFGIVSFPAVCFCCDEHTLTHGLQHVHLYVCAFSTHDKQLHSDHEHEALQLSKSEEITRRKTRGGDEQP